MRHVHVISVQPNAFCCFSPCILYRLCLSGDSQAVCRHTCSPGTLFPKYKHFQVSYSFLKQEKNNSLQSEFNNYYSHLLLMFVFIPPANIVWGGIQESVCLSVFLSVRLSICPSVHLSICPSVWTNFHIFCLISTKLCGI